MKKTGVPGGVSRKKPLMRRGTTGSTAHCVIPQCFNAGYSGRKGFTLIELLVVVLIIGILTAVALPQYQIAVQKARLARLIPLVNALVKAEESFYLMNGYYTSDLSVLDIDVASGCELSASKDMATCTDYNVAIANNATNAQVQIKQDGNIVLGYLHYFAEYKSAKAVRGDIACFAKDNRNFQVCRSLGSGEQREPSSFWPYRYFLSR